MRIPATRRRSRIYARWRRKLPLVKLALAGAEASAGHREEALRILSPMEERYETGNIPAFHLARIHAALGDEPGAVKWLERSMEAREASATYIRAEPRGCRIPRRSAPSSGGWGCRSRGCQPHGSVSSLVVDRGDSPSGAAGWMRAADWHPGGTGCAAIGVLYERLRSHRPPLIRISGRYGVASKL